MSQSRSDTSSVPFSPMAQPNASRLIREKLSARQAKRAAKAAERREKSDALKTEGNAFFRNGEYWQAIDRYQRAIDVHGPAEKPYLLANLAAAYLKLNMYSEGQEAADRALAADPKNIKARFCRGMARKHLEMWTAADIDFRTLLTLDPGNKDAQAELAFVEKVRCAIPFGVEEEDMNSYSDYEAPALEDDPQYLESLSESSDCEHTGNGIPCKFYNHAGCKNGHTCRYSHAPDKKSERDALGRNVCRYFLMGVCKFGERCSYLHSKEHLRHQGWWSTTEWIETERKKHDFLQMCNKAITDYNNQVKIDSGTGPNSNKKPAKGKKKRSHRRNYSGGSRPIAYPQPAWDDYDSDDDYENGTCGFTSNQVNELLSYGVKPWDDDAWDVLHALDYRPGSKAQQLELSYNDLVTSAEAKI